MGSYFNVGRSEVWYISCLQVRISVDTRHNISHVDKYVQSMTEGMSTKSQVKRVKIFEPRAKNAVKSQFRDLPSMSIEIYK